MSYFPIKLPGGIEICSISRTQVACDPCCEQPQVSIPVPIDISTGACNMYIVTGHNLNRIVSVEWFPAWKTRINFKMIPRQTYIPVNGNATFGIIVQDQQTYDAQRGGTITFRNAAKDTVSVPAATFSTWPWLFNPTQIPLQGWDTGYTEGPGGAY